MTLVVNLGTTTIFVSVYHMGHIRVIAMPKKDKKQSLVSFYQIISKDERTDSI